VRATPFFNEEGERKRRFFSRSGSQPSADSYILSLELSCSSVFAKTSGHYYVTCHENQQNPAEVQKAPNKFCFVFVFLQTLSRALSDSTTKIQK